jgi:hypothetical protein
MDTVYISEGKKDPDRAGPANQRQEAVLALMQNDSVKV